MANNQTVLTKDIAGNKLLVTREFNAPVEQVWKAWTDSSLLDQWWAPKPWKAETKTMDFKVGGHWHYCMAGPDGSKQWCRMDYKTVGPQKYYSGTDAFCDEDGKATGEMPSMTWHNEFKATATGTKVDIEISFETADDLHKILEMGFEQGFTAAHGNLDELLARK